MAWNQAIELLSEPDAGEPEESKTLRQKALNIIHDQSTILPETLLDLLTQIIKPLFSVSKHKGLTSTGRKNLVHSGLPTTVDRFGDLYEDKIVLWKNGWTHLLLLQIIEKYDKLSTESQRKCLEESFYLLVPPILHQIDDTELKYKCSGLRCLSKMCDLLVAVESDILRKSGLMDVFVDAMKNDFTLLPTLTEEDDSIVLFREMYPAWRSAVRARFHHSTAEERSGHGGKDESEIRVRYLRTLLRHSLLYGLSHLSVGGGLGTTSYPMLGAFLISQIGWIFKELGVAAVVDLKNVLPLLGNVLLDPFVTSCPELLAEVCKALQQIICVCWPRIRDRWWTDILRGIVQCWLNVYDDLQEVKSEERASKLQDVQCQLKILTALLEDIVGQGFGSSREKLVETEILLRELFNDDLTRIELNHKNELVAV